MNCILFKWKLCLFLDFLIYIYICILLGIGGQNDKVRFQIFKLFRIIPKKINFFQILGGAPRAPSVLLIICHWSTPQARLTLAACVWVDVSHYLKMLQVWELVYPNAPFFFFFFGWEDMGRGSPFVEVSWLVESTCRKVTDWRNTRRVV